MNDIIFVGLDVHKATVAVAVAEGRRGGEVRHLGATPNRADHIAKLAEKIAKGGRKLHFCYEAGPCGYGPASATNWPRPRLHRGGALADPDESGCPGFGDYIERIQQLQRDNMSLIDIPGPLNAILIVAFLGSRPLQHLGSRAYATTNLEEIATDPLRSEPAACTSQWIGRPKFKATFSETILFATL
jgi:hypothetical protein